MDTQSQCQEIVSTLLSIGINFLAIDFDQTLISCHTGGRWGRSAEELAPHVRDFFHVLVPMAFSSGIAIAIVTFSPQVEIIRTVLENQFPGCASRIPIRGEDGSWEYEGTGKREGKHTHMASAAEELMSSLEMKITRKTTLLLDDDPKNIKVAHKHHVRAVLFHPTDVDLTISELLSLGDSAAATPSCVV